MPKFAKMANSRNFYVAKNSCFTVYTVFQLQIAENVSSMCSTPDGKYVIFGYGDGLSAIDTETQEVRALWEQENLLVTDMVSYQFDDNIYVICTIDDLGNLHI